MLDRPRRVLIVTDVALLRWAMSSAFGHSGFVTLTAETADAALDTLRTVEGIDLLVISLSIGRNQVSEVLRSSSVEWPGLPVVLLAVEPDTPPAERHEGTVLLELPFSVADVVATAGDLVPGSFDDVTPDGRRSTAVLGAPRRTRDAPDG
jgi:DNA-binding NtrC family response regulator